jgi:hypothetical protein
MLSVLGFDDGSHCWKEQMWSKKMHLRWCANVVDYAQLYTLCPSSSRAVSFDAWFYSQTDGNRIGLDLWLYFTWAPNEWCSAQLVRECKESGP